MTEQANPGAGMLDRQGYTIGRAIELATGAFFLFAAYLKFTDANAFVPLMHVYVSGTPFDSPTLKGLAALLTIGFETGLGLGMLLGLRARHIVLGLTFAMLLFFTIVIAIVWPEDCGCLPGIKLGPVSTIAKNVVMMALIAVAVVAFRRAGRPESLVLPKAALVILAGLAAAGYSYPQIFRAPSTDAAPAIVQPESGGEAAPDTAAAPVPPKGPYAKYTFETDFGERFDMLSMTCDHCMDSVPMLNNLSMNPENPTLVALGYVPPDGSVAEFTSLTQPMFPIHGIGDNFLEFSELIGQAPPRLAYVVDGVALVHWDWKEEMPSEQEILDGIVGARGASEAAAAP